VTVKLIARTTGAKVTEPYKIMEDIVKTERADLKPLKIGMAWRLGWRPDPDQVLTLGQCRKRGDLDRELDDYDLIILLNAEAFPALKPEEKQRLIYHELMHAQIVHDGEGEPKTNDRGRIILRIRKHDVAAFRAELEKFGDADLSEIAKGRIEDAKRPLLQEPSDS
jgi:hypothetical protein